MYRALYSFRPRSKAFELSEIYRIHFLVVLWSFTNWMGRSNTPWSGERGITEVACWKPELQFRITESLISRTGECIDAPKYATIFSAFQAYIRYCEVEAHKCLRIKSHSCTTITTMTSSKNILDPALHLDRSKREEMSSCPFYNRIWLLSLHSHWKSSLHIWYAPVRLE